MPQTFYRTTRGFTLSELLISVAVLGIIATFVIPKVLVSVSQSTQKALFKETLASIAQVAQSSALANSAPLSGGEVVALFESRFNLQKSCPAGAVAGGCLPADYTGSYLNEPAIVFQNGVVVMFYASIASGVWDPSTVIVDVNGAQGPNLNSTGAINERDVMVLSVNFSGSPNRAYVSCPTTIVQPGQVIPWCQLDSFKERFVDVHSN